MEEQPKNSWDRNCMVVEERARHNSFNNFFIFHEQQSEGKTVFLWKINFFLFVEKMWFLDQLNERDEWKLRISVSLLYYWRILTHALYAMRERITEKLSAKAFDLWTFLLSVFLYKTENFSSDSVSFRVWNRSDVLSKQWK